MRLPLNKYDLNGTVLMGAAVVLLGVAFIANRGDLSSAVLVIAGFAAFLLSIFFFTYTGGEPVDPVFVSLLPVEGCINLCRIAGDLGISGVAYVIPEGTTLSQFNPAGTFYATPPAEDKSFSLQPPLGMRTHPSGLPLYRQLVGKYAWSSPSDPPGLARSIKEVAEDVYHLAASSEAAFDQDLLTLTLFDYRYISGCAAVQDLGSPICCRMYPCPVCSLFMCMVAGSLHAPCTLEQADISPKGDNLTVIIRMVRGAGESMVQPDTEPAKAPDTFIP